MKFLHTHLPSQRSKAEPYIYIVTGIIILLLASIIFIIVQLTQPLQVKSDVSTAPLQRQP